MRRYIATLALIALWWSSPTILIADEDPQPHSGPDAITGGVAVSGVNGSNPSDFVMGTSGEIRGYSVGTSTCNVGNVPVQSVDSSPNHNIIGTNIFRLKEGRFEQLGQAWLFHNFCAIAQSLCSTCTGDPDGCPTLNAGCSDPHTSSNMGNSANVGPKWQVNATTGVFPWPYPSPSSETPAAIRGKVQVRIVDLAAGLNPGALYFLECQNIAPDDAAAGNGLNNASHRRVQFNTNGSMNFGSPMFQTMREEPAIFAWAVNESGVQLKKANSGSDGRFWIGYHATDLGGGVWHYEYAIHNLNSHRSGQSFSVPIPPGVTISNIGFHDVDYHSGEPVIGTDWMHNGGVGGVLTWACDQHNGANDTTANALRWGTLYNFRFDADSPPEDVTATLGLFRPGPAGEANSIGIVVSGPSAAATVCVCPGDLNNSGTVDGADIQPYVSMFLGEAAVSNCADSVAPTGGPLDQADTDAFVDQLMQGSSCES